MKKVSVDTIRNFLKEYKNNCCNDTVKTYQVGAGTFDVRFNVNLTVDERDMFVRRVVSGSFDLFGRYQEEMFLAMVNATIVQMCTNLPALALKGERTEDGQAVLDLEQMDELFKALKAAGLPDEFEKFYDRMMGVCSRAVEERKGYLNQERSSSAAVRDFVLSLRELIERVSTLVSDENVQELLQYAGKLQDLSDSLNADTLAEKVIELHRDSEE